MLYSNLRPKSSIKIQKYYNINFLFLLRLCTLHSYFAFYYLLYSRSTFYFLDRLLERYSYYLCFLVFLRVFFHFLRNIYFPYIHTKVLTSVSMLEYLPALMQGQYKDPLYIFLCLYSCLSIKLSKNHRVPF